MINSKEEYEHKCYGARQAIKTVATIGDLFLQKMYETNGGQLPFNIINISDAIMRDPQILFTKVPTDFDIPFSVLNEDGATNDIDCDDYVIATTLGIYSLENYDDTYSVSYKGIILDGKLLADRMKG